MTEQVAGADRDVGDAGPPADGPGAAPDGTAPDDAVANVAVSRPATWRERRRRRVSRWDRPPEPHDWRFYVGTLGKALIVTGLLMFGFVGYQLWGTGIETARAQHALKDEFERTLAERRAEPDGAADEPDASATDEPADEGPAATTPSASTTVPADDAPEGTTATPTTAGALPPVGDQAATAVDQDIPDIRRGDALALLEIPAIGRSDIVLPGVAVDDLKQGPGHYPDTPLPGQLGNAAIAGHRTTYGAPFFDVDQLVPGDEIIVTMLTGDRFVYLVTGTEIVAADDYWVVTTTDPTVAELTLTSCHPKYTARDRIVVHSVLDPQRSDRVGLPEFYELGDEPGGDADPAPVETTRQGDDPTVTVAAGSVVGAGDSAAAPDPTTGAGTGTPEGPAATSPDDDPARPPVADPEIGGDAFGRGWFSDPGAIPQVALWATALVAITLAGYAVARRTRHTSFGALAGLVPFLVALYFFYQNVNRLLPPGL